MSLHYYKASKSGRCLHCTQGFEHWQVVDVTPLTSCPKCGRPLEHKKVSTFNAPKFLKRPSLTEAKQAGFSIFKKISGDEFEEL